MPMQPSGVAMTDALRFAFHCWVMYVFAVFYAGQFWLAVSLSWLADQVFQAMGSCGATNLHVCVRSFVISDTSCASEVLLYVYFG